MNNKDILINMLSNVTGFSHPLCEQMISRYDNADMECMAETIKQQLNYIDDAVAHIKVCEEQRKQIDAIEKRKGRPLHRD